jgi:hypothetical protein
MILYRPTRTFVSVRMTVHCVLRSLLVMSFMQSARVCALHQHDTIHTCIVHTDAEMTALELLYA